MSMVEIYVNNANYALDDLEEAISELKLSEEDKLVVISGINMIAGVLSRNKDKFEKEAEEEDEAYERETATICRELDRAEINAESEKLQRESRVVKVNNSTRSMSPREAWLARKAEEAKHEV